MENIQTQPRKKSKLEKKFAAISEAVNGVVGSPFWFAFSVILVVVWFFSGFFVGFGDTWQLMINTTTTIMTFLMISLLHSSQKKWEDKIERMQNQEVSTMQQLKKETKKIALEGGIKKDIDTQEAQEQ
jgi:low affinity Fe/Cu permease